MKKYYQKKTDSAKLIARERIKKLFAMAASAAKSDMNLANRYVQLARRIAMKCKVRIPREFKRRFCKNCYCYLIPGKNCRVRLIKRKVVYYCFECKKSMRFPYIKEQKAKRRVSTLK